MTFVKKTPNIKIDSRNIYDMYIELDAIFVKMHKLFVINNFVKKKVSSFNSIRSVSV